MPILLLILVFVLIFVVSPILLIFGLGLLGFDIALTFRTFFGAQLVLLAIHGFDIKMTSND